MESIHSGNKQKSTKGILNDDDNIEEDIHNIKDEAQHQEDANNSRLSSEEVKSKAVVKYSVPCPSKFTKLQCNTDLNLPPSNWLSSSIDYYGLQQVLYHPGEFSSFRMAHMFPDCVGEVDVVSDAENIKRLLKIPYHKGTVSMMVHRVENTLLLDDFDIYKHILRTAETEWEWLRRFFYENIKNTVHSEEAFDRTLYFKSKSRKALNQKSLVSKFLYHSLADSDECKTVAIDDRKSYPIAGPILPEPSKEIPDPSQDHKYNRNVIWTFEDIQMLIGTDMPIFGGGTHPCVSLRLREMSKPINVLTGIDYWLDNLMSNVPEVVMCYHLNGIVQKYELIKTEDLPRLDNSKFSPRVIREVAKSILSFLKSNATKAGHTYWLFKPKDEDVVKLYDLTSLCTKYIVEKDENPFTVPVAMLLYRVARNMKHSCEKQQPGTIRMLLKNCIKLLSEEKYPEIVTSSHYMLSDLYLPAGTDPEAPGFDKASESESENEFVYDEDDDDDNDTDSATKVLILDSDNLHDKFINHYKKPQPISGTVEERCLQAVHHVAQGLACLKYFPQDNNEKEVSQTYEQANIKIPKSHEPIPMPYASLNEETVSKKTSKKANKKRKEKVKKYETALIPDTTSLQSSTNALLLKNKIEAQPLPTWQENYENISWKQHLKTLLYEKIVLVYATLAEQNYLNGNYGSSLRYLGLLVRCHQVMRSLLHNSSTLMENCLLGRTGDCCIMMVHNWDKVDKYQNEFHNQTEEDQKMVEQIEKDEQFYGVNYLNLNVKCVLLYDIRTVEQMLMKGVECYEEALKYDESSSILRRLGNSLNELGNYYLNQVHTSDSVPFILECCDKAEPYLKRGLELFEKVKDVSNIALLYANLGHLNRVLAFANSPIERTELTVKEKVHFNKAFVNYKKALQVLGERYHYPYVWDSVMWDLCSTYFTLGTILHENPSSKVSRTEAEKEVTEMFHQALKYCDLDENNPKFVAFQQRAASIHYRLGSLYHSSVWNYTNDITNKKNAVHLAKLHYSKAAALFYALLDALNFLTVQMQRFALLENLGESATSSQTKINHYHDCLQILIEVGPLIELIIRKEIDVDCTATNDKDEGTSFKSISSLIMLLKDRIQFVLKTLLKLSISKSTSNKDYTKSVAVYKACYSLTLSLDSKMDFEDFLVKLHQVITQIEKKIKSLKEEGVGSN
ncbi:erythroid differentiation-related factor 1 isoform X2 [Agrilus planipennis]|nr:erythroid differentiation-related factor 1 isoform X2 [Agrilus planipennis]XP_018323254.1 erythroid differentiation-related factor 1 isoform X2 [Agrilus planipennis]